MKQKEKEEEIKLSEESNRKKNQKDHSCCCENKNFKSHRQKILPNSKMIYKSLGFQELKDDGKF